MVVFSCNMQHQTAKNILATEEFVVNIPSEDMVKETLATAKPASILVYHDKGRNEWTSNLNGKHVETVHSLGVFFNPWLLMRRKPSIRNDTSSSNERGLI